MKRLLRHLFAPPAAARFPADSLQRIADAIAAGERRHRGEVCFAVEAALPWWDVLRGVEARAQAEAAFARLRVWDTAGNNGVLLYLLLADHRIEIVADRGLVGLVSEAQWRGVCQLMEERLRAGEPEAAVVRGVEAASALLAAHFPQDATRADEDELPNAPHVL
jgi:uncharacterized membrane protein